MVSLGNLLFHNRNWLFPLFYIFLFIPSPWIFENYLIPLFIGFVVAAAGQTIRIATVGLKYIIRGGKNRRVYAEELVTEGLFSHCRNPLYVGNVLILAGLGIMSNSVFFNLLMTPLFIFFYQAIIKAEENFLEGKFGESFRNYMRDVNRWMPSLKGISETLTSMEFNWPRVIVKEYTSAFVWLCGAVLVVLKTFYYQENAHFEIAAKYCVISIIALLFLYLTTRYLKKSKKISG